MNNSQYSSPGFVYFPTSTTPTKNAEETSDYIGFSESPQNQFKPDNYSSPQGCRTSQDYNSPQNHRQRFDRRRTPMQKNQWRHNRNSDSFNQSCNVSNNSFGNNSPRNGSYNRNRKSFAGDSRNSSFNSPFNSPSRSFNHNDKSFNADVFLHPSFTEDPWAALEEKLKAKKEAQCT